MACFDSGIEFKNDSIIIGEPADDELVSKIKIVSKKTGILCANDSTAAVLMSSLNKQGKNVPVDLLMAGFDDMKYAKHLQVPLTSYRQPLLDIVRNSYLMMLRRIANPNQVPVNLNLTGKMVIRGSTSFEN
jgi:DNA-binding LacI/PurR family transcriptional regulator